MLQKEAIKKKKTMLDTRIVPLTNGGKVSLGTVEMEKTGRKPIQYFAQGKNVETGPLEKKKIFTEVAKHQETIQTGDEYGYGRRSGGDVRESRKGRTFACLVPIHKIWKTMKHQKSILRAKKEPRVSRRGKQFQYNLEGQAEE